jgi:hypothetical protein
MIINKNKAKNDFIVAYKHIILIYDSKAANQLI